MEIVLMFKRRLEHRGSSSGRRRPGQAWLSAIRHRPSQSSSTPPTDCRDDHAASTLQGNPEGEVLSPGAEAYAPQLRDIETIDFRASAYRRLFAVRLGRKKAGRRAPRG